MELDSVERITDSRTEAVVAEDEGEQAVDEEVADMVGAAAADGELLEAEEEAEATGADLLLLEVSFPKKFSRFIFPSRFFSQNRTRMFFLLQFILDNYGGSYGGGGGGNVDWWDS